MSNSCFYLDKWRSYTPAKFEVWASIMTLTLDVWPRHFFQHWYSMVTSNRWNFVVMWCVILEKPWSRVLWRTNIVKKKKKKKKKEKKKKENFFFHLFIFFFSFLFVFSCFLRQKKFFFLYIFFFFFFFFFFSLLYFTHSY